jgi:hypothetical protein
VTVALEKDWPRVKKEMIQDEAKGVKTFPIYQDKTFWSFI